MNIFELKYHFNPFDCLHSEINGVTGIFIAAVYVALRLITPIIAPLIVCAGAGLKRRRVFVVRCAQRKTLSVLPVGLTPPSSTIGHTNELVATCCRHATEPVAMPSPLQQQQPPQSHSLVAKAN